MAAGREDDATLTTDALDFYRTHGPITDPGACAFSLEGLPHDIAGICAALQAVMMHHDTANLRGITLGEERMDEGNLRHVSRMLARILELDPRPLTAVRPPSRRLAVVCRDFAVMLCAVLRQQGVPARARCGFALYFRCPDLERGFAYDHWLCEYWHRGEQRWVPVDAEVDEVERAHCAITLDTLDVPPDQFWVAGKAWQMCRAGQANPDLFGLGSRSLHGLWFIASQLVRDLGAMNKRELLCWDTWGLGDVAEGHVFSPAELALLDRVAVLTQADNEAFAALRELYESEDALRVPAVVNSYTARGMVTADVELRDGDAGVA